MENVLLKKTNLRKAIFIYGFLVMVFFLLVFPVTINAQQTVDERREELQKTLNEIDAQIKELNNNITDGKQQATSLKKEIKVLENEARKIELEIKQIDVAIIDTSIEINEKSKEIDQIENKLSTKKKTLGEFMKRIYESDNVPLFEIVLSRKKFSEFFNEMNAVQDLYGSVKEFFEKTRELKKQTEEEKDTLAEQKRQFERMKSIQGVKKSDLVNKKKEQSVLLAETKGKEAEFKKIIVQKKKDAAEIRNQLFLLVGSQAIPFEKALLYANFAFQKTGVRPAFLLGIFKVESELGANVGKGNWREDLSHSRCAPQKEAFVKITSELGLNPDLMPVSKKAWYGYCGGAMGPSQFMPTTWLGYQDQISVLSGHNPPNPWNPQDAFIAASLLLKNNGALANERTAALKYLAGGNWQKSAYKFYGDEVLGYARDYQEQINLLQSLAIK